MEDTTTGERNSEEIKPTKAISEEKSQR